MSLSRKLDIKAATLIKKRIWEGFKQNKVADEFMVAQPTISRIVSGEQWFEALWPDGTIGGINAINWRAFHINKTEKMSGKTSTFNRILSDIDITVEETNEDEQEEETIHSKEMGKTSQDNPTIEKVDEQMVEERKKAIDKIGSDVVKRIQGEKDEVIHNIGERSNAPVVRTNLDDYEMVSMDRLEEGLRKTKNGEAFLDGLRGNDKMMKVARIIFNTIPERNWLTETTATMIDGMLEED